MDCWRQWIRHRTASVNEYSTRYSIAIDSAQRTAPSEWRFQSSSSRQGSSGTVASDEGARLTAREADLLALSRSIYEERIAAGIAREQARKDLPLSTYTEAYWKIDLHNLLHFLALRMDAHAQHEIRTYATLIGEEIVAAWCPMTWEAFGNYRLQRAVLYERDLQVIRHLILGRKGEAIDAALANGMIAATDSGVARSREGIELERKLTVLGLPVPW